MKIIVCGAGQVGTTIARQLAAEGISITVIDTDPDLIRRVDESHDIRGVVGHASYPDTLRDAGAKDADKSFYEGKIATASFFARNFLPLLTSTRSVLENIDNDVMELDEAAF